MCFFSIVASIAFYFFFFFNDTATTEIYTLSLHDALPIYERGVSRQHQHVLDAVADGAARHQQGVKQDRKSTRLNSSHLVISYAVFCLKKKKKKYLLTSSTRMESKRLTPQ